MLRQTKLVVDIEQSTNAEYDIYIDGVNVQEYCFTKADNEYGYKDIQIKIYNGAVKINEDASKAYYSFLDGSMKVLSQTRYIDWFFSDSHTSNYWYHKGNTMRFKHLYAQGPSYFISDKPIWDYEPTLAGYLVDKRILTQQIRNMVCQ